MVFLDQISCLRYQKICISVDSMDTGTACQPRLFQSVPKHPWIHGCIAVVYVFWAALGASLIHIYIRDNLRSTRTPCWSQPQIIISVLACCANLSTIIIIIIFGILSQIKSSEETGEWYQPEGLPGHKSFRVQAPGLTIIVSIARRTCGAASEINLLLGSPLPGQSCQGRAYHSLRASAVRLSQASAHIVRLLTFWANHSR